MNKFMMSALLAGSLAVGVSFAAPVKDSLTAEQKAEWAAKREAMKAKHDSLKTANKGEMDAARAAAKAAREAAQAKFKTLIDAYKAGIAAAKTDAEKAALKTKLEADMKALRATLGDSLGKARGDFHSRHEEFKKRGHDGDSAKAGGLTPEQIAELKKKFEDFRKGHDKGDSTHVHFPDSLHVRDSLHIHHPDSLEIHHPKPDSAK